MLRITGLLIGLLIDPEDGGNVSLRNVYKLLPNYTRFLSYVKMRGLKLLA
jgi:hypothetical protein